MDQIQGFDAVVALNADIVDDLEKTRIANENRLAALTDEEWGKGVSPTLAAAEVGQLTALTDGIRALEREAIRNLESAMKEHPLGDFIAATPGLGFKTCARFLGAVGPLHERTMPSQLWSYCGLAVQDGQAPRARRGEQLGFNPIARKRAWLMAQSCIKLLRSPYRKVYDEARERYADAVLDRDVKNYRGKGKHGKTGDPLSDGHKHNRAVRAVMKAIVRDLWVEARIAAGLKAVRQDEMREAAD